MSEELKPNKVEIKTGIKACPFCGLTPDIRDPLTFQHNQGTKWGFIACCCQGPEVRTSYDISDNAEWHQEAIKAWNTRAGE